MRREDFHDFANLRGGWRLLVSSVVLQEGLFLVVIDKDENLLLTYTESVAWAATDFERQLLRKAALVAEHALGGQ